jgi:hypothetical protein
MVIYRFQRQLENCGPLLEMYSIVFSEFAFLEVPYNHMRTVVEGENFYGLLTTIVAPQEPNEETTIVEWFLSKEADEVTASWLINGEEPEPYMIGNQPIENAVERAIKDYIYLLNIDPSAIRYANITESDGYTVASITLYAQDYLIALSVERPDRTIGSAYLSDLNIEIRLDADGVPVSLTTDMRQNGTHTNEAFTFNAFGDDVLLDFIS